MTDDVARDLAALRSRATAVGLGGLAVFALLAFFAGGAAAMQSWLVAFLMALAVAVGSLAFLMLHALTGGGWGHAIRRVLEASTRTLPWLALVALPIAVWPGALYEWAHPDAVAADPLLQHKAPFLGVGFFRVRLVLYFALWIGLAALCRRLGAADERERSEASAHRLRTVSGPGLGVFGLTVTFAAIDLGMSLDPHWFSTMYGVTYVVGFGLSALCFSVVVASWLSRREPVSRHVGIGQFHDLGNLMLAFTMLWAYVAFSQYLIVWSANLAEEAPYYLSRMGHGWQGLALFLLLFHFAMPFFLLLSRRTKRTPGMLAVLAALMLALRFADLTWLLVPSFDRDGWFPGFARDLAAVVAVGGLWLRSFTGALSSGTLYSAVPGAPAEGSTDAEASHA